MIATELSVDGRNTSPSTLTVAEANRYDPLPWAINRDRRLTDDTLFCRDRSCGPTPSNAASTETVTVSQVPDASHRSTDSWGAAAVAADRSDGIVRSKLSVLPDCAHTRSPMDSFWAS